MDIESILLDNIDIVFEVNVFQTEEYLYLPDYKIQLLTLKMKPIITNVGKATHNGDWNWKNVNSPFMRLYYVTRGSAELLLPDGNFSLTSGKMYCIPAFVTHSCICDSAFDHYYVHIYFELGNDISPTDTLNLPFEVSGNEYDLNLFERLHLLNPDIKLKKSDPSFYDNEKTLLQNIESYQKRDLCDKIESQGLVYQVLSRFIKYSQIKCEYRDTRIQHVLNYINDHLGDRISTDILAKIACLSKEYFIRLFKEEVGITPIKYINKKKVEKGQLLLAVERIPIKNIADRLGIDDYSYFNRIFKKITGFTPLTYRTNIQLQIQK